MAKLSPLPSCTVVSARRTDQGRHHDRRIARRQLNGVLIGNLAHLRPDRQRIWPSEATVGTKARLTPNCLNSIVTVLFCCATGMGNSSPTRKLAGFAADRGQVRLREDVHQPVLGGTSITR